MNHDAYSDAYIRDILVTNRIIAMVGASPNESRPSYFAMKYLKAKGFHVIPVNPGHAGRKILGETVYAALADIEDPSTSSTSSATRKPLLPSPARRSGSGPRWCGCSSACATTRRRAIAEESGLKVVMNRCPKIEYGRLSGELNWAGVNSRMLSSRRPMLGAKGVQHRVLKAAAE